ncbi:MAG: SulP family inorganic anion transporter [Myxococcaceae bacterium]|nr:MAG: SulP family inorganic anion transporter [Myxococcaceae bacterium]
MTTSPSSNVAETSGTAAGPDLPRDVLSGFLVFLIALPLCLGISMASGFPPVAGILTAVIGGLVATWFGSARLTIKGPAAGLIVIALGAVTDLGHGDPALGYRRALAVGVVAAVVQIVFAMVRAGRLGEVFPTHVVHGMLAAIGVIIFSKQAHVMLGVAPHASTPIGLLAELPHSISHLNPEIALVGVLSLGLLFGHLALSQKIPWLRRVPAQLVVLLIAIPLGRAFDLEHPHTYTLSVTHEAYAIGPGFLVNLPASIVSSLGRPDFTGALSADFLKYVVMFALVGSLESLLSARAVDVLDPQRRRSDLDKDLLATGVGNLAAGLLGGLPMISEIVRSSANIGYGARSKLSNFFHGAFLLAFVLLAPGLIHSIPLAALAAMLVFTGVRLASPKEFAHAFHVGPEQLVVFLTTLFVTLATDLLLGVGAGILAKIILQVAMGVRPMDLGRPQIVTTTEHDMPVLRVRGAATFLGLPGLLRGLRALGDAKHAAVELTHTAFVDHTTMERLHEIASEWRREGRTLELRGLDEHRGLSAHPLAARRKRLRPA